MSFLGVIIGLPYLHSLRHPQSKAGAATQSKQLKVFVKLSTHKKLVKDCSFTNFLWAMPLKFAFFYPKCASNFFNFVVRKILVGFKPLSCKAFGVGGYFHKLI